MREKYVDEKWPFLFVLGHDKITGEQYVTDRYESVEIYTKQGAVLVEHFSKLQNEFKEMALEFARSDYEAFIKFWERKD